MCWDTVLEHKGPRSMPLSGAAWLYHGFVSGFNGWQLEGGKLKRVVLELLGLERRFLSFVFL